MSNCKISRADIPYFATTITPSSTVLDFCGVYNLASGQRWSHFAFDSNSTTRSIVFDLGPSYATKGGTIDHFILCRADLLKAAGVTSVTVASSPDNSVWTTRAEELSFASATLYGPRSEDYIKTVTETSAFRYWRITYVSGSSIDFRHSKLFLGKFIDFDDSPDFGWKYLERDSKEFVSSSGVKYFGRTEEQGQIFTITWTLQSDATIQNFYNKVLAYANSCPVVLYAPTETQILDGKVLVHADILEVQEAPKIYSNFSNITVVFEELQG